MIWEKLPAAILRPSGENATLAKKSGTLPGEPRLSTSRVLNCSPVSASQTLMLSKAVEAILRPSAEIAMASTPPALLSKDDSIRPVLVSHTFTVWSKLAETILLPSGENATDVTASEWPSRVRVSCSVSAFHILTVLSALPETIHLPSNEKATEVTASK